MRKCNQTVSHVFLTYALYFKFPAQLRMNPFEKLLVSECKEATHQSFELNVIVLVKMIFEVVFKHFQWLNTAWKMAECP